MCVQIYLFGAKSWFLATPGFQCGPREHSGHTEPGRIHAIPCTLEAYSMYIHTQGLSTMLANTLGSNRCLRFPEEQPFSAVPWTSRFYCEGIFACVLQTNIGTWFMLGKDRPICAYITRNHAHLTLLYALTFLEKTSHRFNLLCYSLR